MALLDITRPVHERMAVYPGNPPVTFTVVAEATDTTSKLTRITVGSHTGTHIDAPAHISANGEGTAMYGLDQLCGPCEVLDVTNVGATIGAADLPASSEPRVLLKTKNSLAALETFDPDFAALDESAAQELIARGVVLLGIDGPSVKRKGVRDAVHSLLLAAGMVIVEGLWLKDVAAGGYTLWCLPLKVDLDGAPVRVALEPR